MRGSVTPVHIEADEATKRSNFSCLVEYEKILWYVSQHCLEYALLLPYQKVGKCDLILCGAEGLPFLLIIRIVNCWARFFLNCRFHLHVRQ